MFYRTTLYNSDEEGNEWKVREYLGATDSAYGVLTRQYSGEPAKLDSYTPSGALLHGRVTLESVTISESDWVMVADSDKILFVSS